MSEIDRLQLIKFKAHADFKARLKSIAEYVVIECLMCKQPFKHIKTHNSQKKFCPFCVEIKKDFKNSRISEERKMLRLKKVARCKN